MAQYDPVAVIENDSDLGQIAESADHLAEPATMQPRAIGLHDGIKAVLFGHKKRDIGANLVGLELVGEIAQQPGAGKFAAGLGALRIPVNPATVLALVPAAYKRRFLKRIDAGRRATKRAAAAPPLGARG